MSSEFSIIKKFFQQIPSDKDVIVGSGDDCAIVRVTEGYELALSIDTLVLDTHFTLNTRVTDVGYKAVTSRLRDLAAMGAIPKWVTMSLTMPQVDQDWLCQFSKGLCEAIREYKIDLIGGDLSRGPLTITVQSHGILPIGSAVLRRGAEIGDSIYVTNTLGDAGYGLTLPDGNTALYRPVAQIAAGLTMRDFASSCIDISDGLLQDLQHMLTASSVGATVYVDKLPLSETLQGLPRDTAVQLALSGGEDYQLLMTIPKKHIAQFELAMPTRVTCIGEIVEGSELIVLNLKGERYRVMQKGYQHF